MSTLDAISGVLTGLPAWVGLPLVGAGVAYIVWRMVMDWRRRK